MMSIVELMVSGEVLGMPKRDPAYMETQRESIAQATLDCLLEKGLYVTSLRDIYQRAGISNGALYVHFTVRTTWASYIDSYQEERRALSDERNIRRARLSLQIAADLALAQRNPERLTALYAHHMTWIRDSLKSMHRSGEITLPLGLDATASTHSRLMVGTIYMILSNKQIDPDEAWRDMTAASAVTAGRIWREPTDRKASTDGV